MAQPGVRERRKGKERGADLSGKQIYMAYRRARTCAPVPPL